MGCGGHREPVRPGLPRLRSRGKDRRRSRCSLLAARRGLRYLARASCMWAARRAGSMRACSRCLASCHRRSPSPTARARCFGAARPFSSCWQAPAPPGICRGSAKASPRRRRRSSGCSRPPAGERHSPRPSRFRKWRAARPFTSRRPPGWIGPAAWNTLSGNSRRRRLRTQASPGAVLRACRCPRCRLPRICRCRRRVSASKSSTAALLLASRPGRCSGPGAASRSHAPGSGI